MKFRIEIFLVIFGLVTLLTFLSFVGELGIEQGSTSIFLILFSKLFLIFRFPTHVLFGVTFNHGEMFFLGYFINIFLYSLMIERLIAYRKNLKSKRK